MMKACIGFLIGALGNLYLVARLYTWTGSWPLALGLTALVWIVWLGGGWLLNRDAHRTLGDVQCPPPPHEDDDGDWAA